MQAKKITDLVNAVYSYSLFRDELRKKRFASAGKIFLRGLAKDLGIDADVRYNPAGIACSGDVVLHGDSLYVSFNADNDLGILVRTCKGRKDYSGGANYFIPFSHLVREFQAGFPTFQREVNR